MMYDVKFFVLVAVGAWADCLVGAGHALGALVRRLA